MKLLEFMFSGFWTWFGCMLVLVIAIEALQVVFKGLALMIHGFPSGGPDAEDEDEKKTETKGDVSTEHKIGDESSDEREAVGADGFGTRKGAYLGAVARDEMGLERVH